MDLGSIWCYACAIYLEWKVCALSESGIWDTASRVDMLMLRFLTKICSSDPESLVEASSASCATVYTVGHVTYEICNALETRWNLKDCVHTQLWAQQGLAAASRLGVPL